MATRLLAEGGEALKAVLYVARSVLFGFGAACAGTYDGRNL